MAHTSSIASQGWLHSQTDDTASVHAAKAQKRHRRKAGARLPPNDPQIPATPTPTQDQTPSGNTEVTRIYLGPVSQGAPRQNSPQIPAKVWLDMQRQKKHPTSAKGRQPTTRHDPPNRTQPPVSSGGSGVTVTNQETAPVKPRLPPNLGAMTLKRLQGEGPLNLEPATGPAADIARIRQFGMALTFYRNDKSASQTRDLSSIDKTAYEARHDVIAFGKGTDGTSYVPEAKAYIGRAWTTTPTELSGTDIVKLGAGKDGTAAIMLPFDQLRLGSTVIVTGGPMRGSTMLFAADNHGFYAYHAGTSSNEPRWTVSEDGARSIANAYRAMHPAHHAWITARSGADELVSIAKLEPFSALIYNGAYSTEPGRKLPDERIHAPLHATGTEPNDPWHMMTFSYFEPGDVRSVGTAQAVISKDAGGKITVQVMGEKGKLDHMQTMDLHGGSVGFRYRPIEGATTSYTVEPSKQR
ncbi:hypothetical protein LMG29739_03890 [Paraburkholderia solisilvae]|uniref:Cytotoxic necrotizing factor Rho-activating domain-containing protein n=2 Tax=Paraburkholderia solisilvae TaxID=624376 RepID=A0A6J5E7H3_9BURK|nr:hypothetical protein LMG29739_03890 [Paraburkholderia solisilvae]